MCPSMRSRRGTGSSFDVPWYGSMSDKGLKWWLVNMFTYSVKIIFPPQSFSGVSKKKKKKEKETQRGIFFNPRETLQLVKALVWVSSLLFFLQNLQAVPRFMPTFVPCFVWFGYFFPLRDRNQNPSRLLHQCRVEIKAPVRRTRSNVWLSEAHMPPVSNSGKDEAHYTVTTGVPRHICHHNWRLGSLFVWFCVLFKWSGGGSKEIHHG